MSKLLAGRYELIEKIGEGGMAIVYKAKCRLLNRYVAIKILRPEYTKNKQFIENFKNESQAAAGLQHPNIVSVYDVGKEGDIHFIVMELVDGKPLSEIIEEKAPLDYKVAIEITRQVASALSLAHKNNIIHRDVKPHNIMITKDGTAKLADFGIAKAVSDSPLASETTKIIGSVHYFSPEQARGSYVDERSDIYSLGIVLYEMLTGQVPFDGDNPVQVALMHINDEIVPPSKIVSGIPPALEKLVMKATDKYQTNRYRNAEELLEDIDNIEFVTKMVGNSIFAASDVDEYRKQNSKSEVEEELAKTAKKPAKKKKKAQKKPLTEEEEASKKKKIIIGSVVGAVVVIAIVAGIFLLGGKDKGDIKVPDLKNMTYEEAETALTELKLKIKKGDEIPSKEIEEGKIVSQSPSHGTKVEKDTVVTVNISSGNETTYIPDLVGRTFNEKEIRDLLEQYNYKLGKVTKEESEEEKDIILSQTPEGGTEAEEGTVIDIVVSKESTKKTVPNVIGINVKDAKKAIIDAGFNPSISYEESSAFSKDIVMWQQFDEGDKLEKGSTINITVSKGPSEIETPVEPVEPVEPPEEPVEPVEPAEPEEPVEGE